MTTSTSSRSAKATPKTAAEPDTNGTQPEEIESPFVATSTTWRVTDSQGLITEYNIPGNGRISFSAAPHSNGELRIYRNESTKVFEAVVRDVQNVVSSKVVVKQVGITAEREKREKQTAEHMKKVTSAVIAGRTPPEEDDDYDPVHAFSIGFPHKKSW